MKQNAALACTWTTPSVLWGPEAEHKAVLESFNVTKPRRSVALDKPLSHKPTRGGREGPICLVVTCVFYRHSTSTLRQTFIGEREQREALHLV